MLRALALCLLCAVAQAAPFAQVCVPPSEADACDYENITLGQSFTVPVEVDPTRGCGHTADRVCKTDTAAWPTSGSVGVRFRARITATGEVSDWLSGDIPRAIPYALRLANNGGGTNMAITYATTTADSVFNTSSPISSSSISVTADDILVFIIATRDLSAGTITVSNSGTAFTWTQFVTQTSSGAYIYGYWAKATASISTVVSFAWNSGNALTYAHAVIKHTGAHLTSPIPAGNVFSGAAGTDISQSITPSASGSALWLYAHDFGAASNTFAAGANCTSVALQDADYFKSILVRPTTQPRTDASAFTLSETDTGGTVSWIAFEVQAAGSATTRGMPFGDGAAFGGGRTFGGIIGRPRRRDDAKWQRTRSGLPIPRNELRA